MHSEDIQTIVDKLKKILKDDGDFLNDTNVGGILDEAIEELEDIIAYQEPIEAAQEWEDRHEIAGEAMYDSEKGSS